eukprot:CAMPEP_0185604616 /NCGR_PEP_ID=MMETSP0436-20130131/3432_1 /TAXON_ID=626734 ORGANISM="Favella taraikaensis, Strain Fe Narragansett Bay" /NCGR_SAMPLE_ID=MMETSP0436 /ASSEMBLY_ACC=CAM_ASM_000390 /LENGTH=37 /DNA_ID= /DNA_START= /DNA_END= /DNA_ORIENTATION=
MTAQPEGATNESDQHEEAHKGVVLPELKRDVSAAEVP